MFELNEPATEGVVMPVVWEQDACKQIVSFLVRGQPWQA